jgi:hypothetical protein
MKQSLFVATVAIVCAFAPRYSAAAIIYQDNFDGSATTNLNGLAPDVDNNGGTNTWVAYSGYKANGQIATASVNQGAWLPVTPLPGLIYTLSASFTGVGPDGTSLSWIAVGFAKQVPTTPETGANRFIEGVTLGRA